MAHFYACKQIWRQDYTFWCVYTFKCKKQSLKKVFTHTTHLTSYSYPTLWNFTEHFYLFIYLSGREHGREFLQMGLKLMNRSVQCDVKINVLHINVTSTSKKWDIFFCSCSFTFSMSWTTSSWWGSAWCHVFNPCSLRCGCSL